MMQDIYQSLNQEIIEFFRQKHTHQTGDCNKELAERFISNQEIRELMKDEKQRSIFNHELRTHSDISERLYLISKDIPGVIGGSFFGYDVLINPNALIFATAMGMNAMIFRLSAADRKLAMELGSRNMDGLSQEWVLVDPWAVNLPQKKVMETFNIGVTKL